MSRAKSLSAVIVFALTCLLQSPLVAAVFTFNQIDWLDNSGGFTSKDSDWGQVDITLTSADWSLFPGGSGFINIVTRTGVTGNWAVRNLPISASAPTDFSGRLPQSVWFDLGITPGTDVSALDFMVSYDPSPVSTLPTGTFASVSVGAFNELLGGEIGMLGGDAFSGTTGQAAPPEAQNFWGAAAGEQQEDAASIAGAEADVEAVDEEESGCAPAAVARSLKYLAAQHANISISDTVQDVYDDLKSDMETVIGPDGGTDTAKILSGKDKYVARENLPIVSEQSKDFDDAIKTLKEKGDVEVGVYWGKNESGDSLGAHRAFVSEIIELSDADGMVTGYTVKIIDDVQGDMAARNRTHTLKFKADGTLEGWGTGATLINFQVQRAVPEPGTVVIFCILFPVALIFASRRSNGKN